MQKTLSLAGLLVLTLTASAELLAQGSPKEDRVVRLMEEYTNAPGPTGDEGPVRDLVIRDLKGAGAEVSMDGMGSVIGVLHGASERPRIMVDAHMDEVGMMVQYVRPDGFVAFKSVA